MKCSLIAWYIIFGYIHNENAQLYSDADHSVIHCFFLIVFKIL